MKKREGFTLAELILSVFIFGFISASLATIVSTTNRHMFQNYRRNIIKTNLLLSMRAIQNNLSVATRVDLPAIGGQGNVLAFAVNVDQMDGCYPISAGNTVSWHYFCLAANTNLYYYTGTINGNAATACGTPGPALWNPGTGYTVPACGGNGGTLMMENASPPPSVGTLFTRRPADGVNEADIVRIALRTFWSAAGRGFGSSQRDVDSTLDSVVKFNRARP